MTRRITSNRILEVQYKHLLGTAYVPEGDETAVISGSIQTRHDPVYFLYGRFLRLASPMDLSRFKPTTLAALNTETIDDIVSRHDGDVFDIMLTNRSISNITRRIQARYEEVITMAAIAICECSYTAVPYLGEDIAVPEVFNQVLGNLASSFNQNPHHSEMHVYTFLSDLHKLNQSGDESLEAVTDIFLSIFRDMILNFFISFSGVLESEWDFESFDYQSRYSKLTPKAFVTKMFFDLEKSYLNFFTRKFKEEKLDFLYSRESSFVNPNTLSLIEQIRPVKVDKTFLASIEATFTELITPLIFKHVVVPRTKPDDFIDKLRDIKVYYSLQAFQQMQEYLDTNTYLGAESLDAFLNNTLTDPKKFSRKKRKKKKNRAAKTSENQSSLQKKSESHSAPTARINFTPAVPQITIAEILDLQLSYFEYLEVINAKKVQLEKLIHLKQNLQECLSYQEGISSPEVLEWFQKSYDKANQLPPVTERIYELDTQFTDLLTNFDSNSITPENKQEAIMQVSILESESSRISFEINQTQLEINSSFQTLDSVIRRIFRDTLDETTTIDEPIDIFEIDENTDYRYIKSAFGNTNPRFERLSKLEEFLRMIGLRVATGGKHLALYKGDVKICALALTTIQEGKLYMKELVSELYRDHGIDKDLLYTAITEYLK